MQHEHSTEFSAASLLSAINNNGAYRQVAEQARAFQLDRQQQEYFYHQMLVELVQLFPDAIAIANLEGQILFGNERARELLSMPSLDIPPEEWGDHFTVLNQEKEPVDLTALPLLRTLKTGQPNSGNFWIKTKKHLRLLHISARAICPEPQNEIIGGVLLWRLLKEDAVEPE